MDDLFAMAGFVAPSTVSDQLPNLLGTEEVTDEEGDGPDAVSD